MTTAHPDSSPDQTFLGLMAIAAQIGPHEAAWRGAWEEVLGPHGNSRFERLKERTAALNAAIEPHLDDIARTTNNAASTIRSVFRPRSDTEVWFGGGPALPPSTFLRQVARYRSFNMSVWRERARAHEMRELATKALGGEPLPADVAAGVIESGGVPVVSRSACARPFAGSATLLEQALFLRGVLRPYLPQDVERWERLMACGAPMGQHIGSLSSALSAVRSFAYQQQDLGDGLEIVFWPIDRTATHQVRRLCDAQAVAEDDADALPQPRA